MSEGIAIVGLAAVFPGAPNVDQYWRNICAGVSAITDTPASRWSADHFDPSSSAIDRFYCRRGGFLPEDLGFDAARFGVMPIAAQGAEPDQLLALSCAAEALRDAGFDESRVSRSKTGVILGRGGYLGPGLARVDQGVRVAATVAASLRQLIPDLEESKIQEIKAELQREAGPYGPDTAVGLVPNLAASRISNRFDLGGPSYTVDAACASSLLAIDHACRELESGRCDFIIAGGIHVCHDVTFWSVFTQLGALSRQQEIRPFDSRADGLLIGEGVGMVALRRLRDAQRDGDRVYAVIRGTGVSSDGRGATLMRPSVAGQTQALERAWEHSGLDPNTVGLVEAHGTGTPVGDEAEMRTVDGFFGRRFARGPVIGSVKSMIGHTMPAAGAAGVIKAALAIHHGILPPTIGLDDPIPALRASQFRTLREAAPWNADRRRAGVNAFGFGGINAHVVLESPPSRETFKVVALSPKVARSSLDDVAPPTAPVSLFRAAAATPAELRARIARGETGGDGPVRLVLLNPTNERLERAIKCVDAAKPVTNPRGGLWYTPRCDDAATFKTALLFPGLDSSFSPRVDDLAQLFDLSAAGIDPTLDPATDAIEQLGFSIIHLNRFLHRALQHIGVSADVFGGHSIGEWSAMIASGMIPEESVDPFIKSLTRGELEVPEVIYAAVGCSASRARTLLVDLPDIEISHDNCPHQVILCGTEGSIEKLVDRFMKDGVLCQRLPFRSGFHSSNLRGYLGAHETALARLPMTPPKTPVFSATTCAPYPTEPKAVKALSLDHLLQPVRFREMIEALYAQGTRLFIQCGTGSLVGFVGDTLRGRPHGVVAANDPRRSGVEQLCRVAAVAWVQGIDVDWTRLPILAGEGPSDEKTQLRFGAPTSVISAAPIAIPIGDSHRDNDDVHPVHSAYQSVLDAIADASTDAVKAWETQANQGRDLTPRSSRTTHRLSSGHFPAVMDHCFYRQPSGWADASDRFPVIPMTTSIHMMQKAAESLVPDRAVLKIEDVRAWQWLVVEPEVEIEVVARFDGSERVEVEITDYASAVFTMGSQYAKDLPPPLRLAGPGQPGPTDAESIYDDRWMFHGPQFQAICELGPLYSNGLRGTLEVPPTPGALLDNAGQLFGYWVMATHTHDRLAMPVKIDRIQFFDVEPAVGSSVECLVQITENLTESVTASIDLRVDGRSWARIEGWHDRRFESDPALWDALRFPETNAVGQMGAGGYCLVKSGWKTSASRDLVARRYLGRVERDVRRSLRLRRRHSWLLGRMAAKDAARHWLWSRGTRRRFSCRSSGSQRRHGEADDHRAGPPATERLHRA